MVSPAAMAIVEAQANLLLAIALLMTRKGNAITSPRPRTVRPKTITAPTINAALRQAKEPMAGPRATHARINAITPMKMSAPPRREGKYAGPMRSAVPIL